MVYIDKRTLATFIAEAINSTAKVKSKTERIHLIVNAAGRHLSMTGLTWAEVREGLNQQGLEPCITGS
jgi:hypothetical protein